MYRCHCWIAFVFQENNKSNGQSWESRNTQATQGFSKVQPRGARTSCGSVAFRLVCRPLLMSSKLGLQTTESSNAYTENYLWIRQEKLFSNRQEVCFSVITSPKWESQIASSPRESKFTLDRVHTREVHRKPTKCLSKAVKRERNVIKQTKKWASNILDSSIIYSNETLMLRIQGAVVLFTCGLLVSRIRERNSSVVLFVHQSRAMEDRTR